jgi:hypothetical protein
LFKIISLKNDSAAKTEFMWENSVKVRINAAILAIKKK